ncbi:alpha/beta fold hydrolase [Microbispora hainanensis]|uniref:Alpha/beta fold hydrolase n=1 Tax=Microbispora hainanensis TaxID=568844 RepID=A0A544YPI3_9ACTN|nr:alpha/beta hydrolase [Microbispora hainanensis]TQS18675.1 alpha/beta fold hydrolase [Microbispora hainanensis]
MTSADGGFLEAYDAVLAARWPASTETAEIRTPYGTTRVNSVGPAGAPPVVLLRGGGTTSTVWSGTATALGTAYRVHAVDTVGDAGRSVAGERPIRKLGDQMAWLDAVLDGLGTSRVSLCGHSYGAWSALHYALHNAGHAPGRVRAVVLIDPTGCFAGFSRRYLLRALPMLLRPTVRRRRAFLGWETGHAALDETWLRLYDRAASFPAARPLTGPRPAPEALRALRLPVLLLLAERSRAHDIGRVAASAAALLPRVETAVLPGATHHTLPLAAPPEMDARIGEFLAAHGRDA